MKRRQHVARFAALVGPLCLLGALALAQAPPPPPPPARPQPPEAPSAFTDSEGVAVPQRQVLHCGSRAEDHTAHWYQDNRNEQRYCPGGPAQDPVVLRDPENKPVRRSQARHCGSADANHAAHWYTDPQGREFFCEGGAAIGARRSAGGSYGNEIVAQDARGNPVYRRDVQHCGIDYDHAPHWYRTRGHEHWCPGGPHRHYRRY